MATRHISQSKSQTGLQSFTRALTLAFNEWLLMFMLFVNSIFSYLITWFADYSDLQSPCLMCSRLDQILRRTTHLKGSHWDMVCSKHKTEISSLVYCHAHDKLVDVRGMCETCLFSFATTNKSNAETYRLLVGKLGEDSSFGSKSDSSMKSRYCTCCHELWMPQAASTDHEVLAKPVNLPKIRLVSNVKTGKQSTTPKKSVSFNHLPHVGYTQLKIHSDTESEAVFSEDEGVSKHHKFQSMDLKTPPVITLPYDLATDKLLNLDFPLQPLVPQNDLMGTYDSFFPETSEKVLKEKEISSLDSLFLTSTTIQHTDSTAALKEKEDLIHFQDTSSTPDFKETPADALMEETELIPVICVPETPKKALKEEEIISFDNLFITSRTMEPFAAVSKEKEDLIHLRDTSLTPDFKENPENALMDETELICLKDVTSTSVAAETHEDVLMGETVLQGKEELVHLLDVSLTPDSKESHACAPVEEAELICLNDVTSTSVVAETSEDVLMGETFLKEKEELVHLQDTSLGEDFGENPADSLMEKTELVCLSDVTSTSSDAETPEDVLKGIEVMPLHETSPDKVPESFTTNETLVETLKERDTNQDDSASLGSDYVVVSPSKSARSMPEDSTEDCVLANKETKETSLTVSSVSEMASHTEAAPESESASFNSISVAAETNLGSSELLDLTDAYNSIESNDGSNDSNGGGAHIEQWMKKDTSRITEDLKALLTQISASRGIEFLSPRDSPKISTDQETKNIDLDMQLLIQKRMLERNESNVSLEGVSVSEIEGESESDRLKRQVDYDRKLLTGLYKELEEERSASAVATNQAMAMITRLQEEKALFQMEALQNLRMMEEQAEYDMEAIQKLNDLLVDREKLIQDLEAEIEYFRDQTPQKNNKLDVAENVTGIDSTSERMSNQIQNCLTGFNEERLYITSCLENLENRVQTDVNGEASGDNLATEESVSELHERVEKLKGDLYFLEHVVNSLGNGNESVEFVKEIASHLQTLRSLSMKRHNHTES